LADERGHDSLSNACRAIGSCVTVLFNEYPILAGILALVVSLVAAAIELVATKSKGPPALTWLTGAGAIISAVGSSSYSATLRLLVILVLLGTLVAGIRWTLANV
jgi:hypothetical protein